MRNLDLSVAVASQRLKRLEGELGVRLLPRPRSAGHCVSRCPPSLGLYGPPLLPEFLRMHARYRMNIDRPGAGHGQGSFDPGIRIGVLKDSSLVARKLATNRRALCAANLPGAPWRAGTARRTIRTRMHPAVRKVAKMPGNASAPMAARMSCWSKAVLESNFVEVVRDATVARLGSNTRRHDTPKHRELPLCACRARSRLIRINQAAAP